MTIFEAIGFLEFYKQKLIAKREIDETKIGEEIN